MGRVPVADEVDSFVADRDVRSDGGVGLGVGAKIVSIAPCARSAMLLRRRSNADRPASSSAAAWYLGVQFGFGEQVRQRVNGLT